MRSVPTSIVGVTVNAVLLPLQNIFFRFVASTLVFFVFQYSPSILILRNLLIYLKFDSKSFTHVKLTNFMSTISWTPLPLVNTWKDIFSVKSHFQNCIQLFIFNTMLIHGGFECSCSVLLQKDLRNYFFTINI